MRVTSHYGLSTDISLLVTRVDGGVLSGRCRRTRTRTSRLSRGNLRRRTCVCRYTGSCPGTVGCLGGCRRRLSSAGGLLRLSSVTRLGARVNTRHLGVRGVRTASHCHVALFDVIANFLLLSLLFLVLCLRHGHGIGLRLYRGGRRLSRTHSRTRTTGGTGDVFLRGVDRRVQAPLGSVINFSRLVASPSTGLSRRRERSFYRLVRRGSSLLLALIKSVLDTTRLRDGECAVGVTPRDYGGLYQRTVAAIRRHGPRNIGLCCASRISSYCRLDASKRHIYRVLVGFLAGTRGRAARNRVHLRYSLARRPKCIAFSIASANANVPPRCSRAVFRHFRGTSGFKRNANLKLGVYHLVTRQLGKGILLSGRCGRKTEFIFMLPIGGSV